MGSSIAKSSASKLFPLGCCLFGKEHRNWNRVCMFGHTDISLSAGSVSSTHHRKTRSIDHFQWRNLHDVLECHAKQYMPVLEHSSVPNKVLQALFWRHHGWYTINRSQYLSQQGQISPSVALLALSRTYGLQLVHLWTLAMFLTNWCSQWGNWNEEEGLDVQNGPWTWIPNNGS